MAYSGSCRYAARKCDHVFLQEKKATKDGATSFSASLHSLVTSTIPSSVTAPWWREANFHAVLANQLYSKEDPPLKLFKGQRGQGMKLPWHCISTSSGRVQGIFKCQGCRFRNITTIHETVLMTTSYALIFTLVHPFPIITLSPSLPATLFALRISSLLSPPGAPPPGSNVLIGVTFPLRPQANGTVQVLQLVITDS